ADFLGLHARFRRRLALVADIDLACRILADQHHSEPRCQAVPLLQRRDLPSRLLADTGRKYLAINDCCAHPVPSSGFSFVIARSQRVSSNSVSAASPCSRTLLLRSS